MNISNLPEQIRHLYTRNNPRPTTWDDFIGNGAQVEIIREAIASSQTQNRPLPHTLLFGPPGVGKSTLSKQIARSTNGGFIEISGSNLETPLDVIKVLHRLTIEWDRTQTYPVLFVDEIHTLGMSKGRQAIDQESIYPLLEDFYFPHNLQGKKYELEHGEEWTLESNMFIVPPFTCIGATTDPGILNQAILRRFLLHIEMAPYTEEEISRIILGTAERLGWEIDSDAAMNLAKMSRLNPGKAYSLLTSAQNRAVAASRPRIDLETTQEVLNRLNLYRLGLSHLDVKILKLLADRMPRGMGQAELCRATNISPSQFSAMVEPFLRQLGFVETLSRRVITQRGLRYLVEIGHIDTNRLEVRAAIAAAS